MNFIEGTRSIMRIENGKLHIRVIGEDTVMYVDEDLETMKMYRDFLNKQIELLSNKEA